MIILVFIISLLRNLNSLLKLSLGSMTEKMKENGINLLVKNIGEAFYLTKSMGMLSPERGRRRFAAPVKTRGNTKNRP